ncbi:MAG TPA: hypothetical protein VFI32_10910 [Rhodanobacteraceae bacterium]|nr:hypothetical protein [Rhodanobacteraceae bacterium]
MDIPTSLTRSTVTVLVPGIVALSPWVLALVQHTQATFGFKGYPTLAHSLLFASVIVAGVVCDGLGSFIEAKWDDMRDDDLDVEENWYKYLSMVFEREPVGYRYLSRLVTALYFELSMLFAVPIFMFGACVLAWLRFPAFRVASVICTIVCIVGAALFFLWQAYTTHGVICTTRRELMRRVSAS